MSARETIGHLVYDFSSGILMQNGLLLLGTLLFLARPTHGQEDKQNWRGQQFPPIQGSVKLQTGDRLRFTYHFDHNALMDGVRIGDVLVVITGSGNLLRFDAMSLNITGQEILRGRATAICVDDPRRVLVGTQDGQIVEVDPATLAYRPVFRTEGRIAWLGSRVGLGGRSRVIIAIVDNSFAVWARRRETSKKPAGKLARREKAENQPYFIAVYDQGTQRFLTLSSETELLLPNFFFVDESNRLWMGTDLGEWGGFCSYMDLRTGKVRALKAKMSGVTGLLRSADGRLLMYGGMSHMGMEDGYVSQIKGSKLEYLSRFESDVWRLGKDEQERRPDAPANTPGGPIDLVTEDLERTGFWVVSAHVLYHTNSNFSAWTRVAELGGRGGGGRRFSVGTITTVTRLILDHSGPQEILVLMGRDGLAKVSSGTVQRRPCVGQLEPPLVEIWKTSIGTVFLGNELGHQGWRLEGDQWRRLRFFPDEGEPAGGGFWFFAEPFGDDGSGLIAFSGDNIGPGERALVRVRADGNAEVIHTWKEDSSELFSTFLGTSEGELFKITEKELRRWDGTEWREAGQSNVPHREERSRTLRGRQYVSLGRVGTTEYFLDAAVDDLLQLTRKSENTFQLAPVSYETRAAPSGITDADGDGDGWILAATAKGLIRLRLDDGQVESIPGPNTRVQIQSLCRDSVGRLWAAGDGVYVSLDEGKHWEGVDLPMLSQTYLKRVRNNPKNPRGVILAIDDQGVVSIEW
jgi:hypothetical protein